MFLLLACRSRAAGGSGLSGKIQSPARAGPAFVHAFPWRSASSSAPAPAPAAAAATSSVAESREPAPAEVPESPNMPPPLEPLSYYRTPSSEPVHDASFVGLSGGQIFHEMMLRHRVQHVFGYPGGAILPVFDAIYNSSHFDFVLPRHEQGAGHMAEGYARATGRPGVVLVTSGPGATNVVTPMQDALSDGVPLVVFTGQVPITAIGTDAFQEADIIGISRACTKWNVMVKNIEELPQRISEAFKIATSGRPGPVLVDLPKNVTAGVLRRPIPAQTSVASRSRNPYIDSHGSAAPVTAGCASVSSLRNAAELINRARRPVIYSGQGVLSHPDGPAVLRKLSSKSNIPVTTTLHGMGAFDELDQRSLHMLGMHGSVYANLAMQTADLIIALGARFDDRVTGNLSKFAPEAKRAANEGRGGFLHFEIAEKNINKVVEATQAVRGDVTENLKRVLPLVGYEERKEWFDAIAEWKRKYPFSYTPPSSSTAAFKPQQVIQELDRQTAHMKDDVIITTGVGQHQMWTAQFFRCRSPRSFITSGGMGTMGFGLPAAIGAKAGMPDKIVIDIDGDASFCMTGMELATAAQYGIGVKVLLLNNDFQGMVKQWQDFFYERRYSATAMKNPDFVKLAEAMGCKGLRLRAGEDNLSEVVSQFLQYPGPVLLDAIVEKHEHVYPMVASGKGLDEMDLGPGLKLTEKACILTERP